MKPFFVTTLQAAKMPRWLLLVLCALYVVPGLAGRDPWRFEDAAGFGVAWTMALAPRGAVDWLMPNVLGVPVTIEGPLPFWLGAIAIRALPFIAPDTVVRGVAMAWLALFLTCVWYATWLLARRPEAQPADPFGASASRSDFGRAIADSALLVALATFGLLARAHETTAESAQVAWIGVFLFAAGSAILVGELRRWRAASPVFAERAQLRLVWAIFLPMVLYVAAIALIGIYLASFALILFFMVRHGRYRVPASLAVAIGVPLFFFLVFERWFLVQLPKGPIEQLLGF